MSAHRGVPRRRQGLGVLFAMVDLSDAFAARLARHWHARLARAATAHRACWRPTLLWLRFALADEAEHAELRAGKTSPPSFIWHVASIKAFQRTKEYSLIATRTQKPKRWPMVGNHTRPTTRPLFTIFISSGIPTR
jgi:hypothetical protein